MKKLQLLVLSFTLIASMQNLYAGKKNRKNFQRNEYKIENFKKESGHSKKENNRNHQNQINDGLNDFRSNQNPCFNNKYRK